MGRRHFHFSPAVRGHLAEGACRVVSGAPDLWPAHATRRHLPPPLDGAWCEEPPTPSKRVWSGTKSAESWNLEPEPLSTARRMYPRREASPSGATRDFSSILSRRHTPAPMQAAPESGRRRHFADSYNLFEELEEAPSSGKRHVHSSTPEHLSLGAPQVRFNEESPSSRRHCRELGGRPASAHAARRGTLPPQRRHLMPEARARASNHPPSAGMASALRSGEAAPWQPPGGSRRATPSRRLGMPEPEGHLLGGYLCPSWEPSGLEPFFTRRHYEEPPAHMIGGTLRQPACSAPAWAPYSTDNLIGGAFRSVSAPSTPRRYSGTGHKAASVAAPSW